MTGGVLERLDKVLNTERHHPENNGIEWTIEVIIKVRGFRRRRRGGNERNLVGINGAKVNESV